MLDSDLDVLFSGPDAVEATIGASVFKGLLDSPDQELSDGLVISTEYVLTTKTSNVSEVEDMATVTINSEDYKIRKTMMIDDGLLSKVYLSKE